ncbi:MAG: glutamate--tRNA ligase [Rickettsiales bacterium]|nr:glutamate--tRNA ligase [Rickettsiales bacterium]
MNVSVRFAPSPTGLLHVGNVRTALINWLFAKKHSGNFILRMDDTDYDRSEEKFEQAIIEDLSWLGLKWDRLEHQKDRIDRYEEIKEILIKEGWLYPCYETEEELEIKRKIRLSQGKPPIYDRASLKLTSKQKFEYEQSGKRPHFRFKLKHEDVIWDDLIQGQVKMNAGSFSDPIVIRGNGTWTYLLCSIVDDIDFGITHIIRGEDHISNTVAQIQFFKSLKKSPPIFAHLARIVSKSEKISKRTGGFDIKTLREQKEIEAMSINSFFALIGTSRDVSVFNNIEELVSIFDINNFHKSPIHYEEDDLIRLNHKILSNYSFIEVEDRLKNMDMPLSNEAFWNIVHNNINKLSESKYWYDVCYSEIKLPEFSNDDKNFLERVYNLLPEDSKWNDNTWSKWIESIKLHTDKKGKGLFMLLRRALTGVDYGPELKFLLTLIGEDKIKKRLRGINGSIKGE